MTTKWNLINLDSVPPPDKFSVKEKGKGNCVLRMFSAPTFPSYHSTFLPG